MWCPTKVLGLQKDVQSSVSDELEALQAKHASDGLLQLQLAADKLDFALASVSYDHAKVLHDANLPEEAAARPWRDAAAPVQDALTRCAAPPNCA
jgi:hypothetical protein